MKRANTGGRFVWDTIDLPAGSQIAFETSGSYYRLVDEMERAGRRPLLAHALTAKRRMEARHKTDERDARGLAMLLRNGTLPQAWIPPAELRDQREMLRLPLSLVRMKTQVKNRLHGVLLRYNLTIQATDLYRDRGREELLSNRQPRLRLPEPTQRIAGLQRTQRDRAVAVSGFAGAAEL